MQRYSPTDTPGTTGNLHKPGKSGGAVHDHATADNRATLAPP